MERLRKNLDGIRSRIAGAAARSGRSPEEVTLVAVTKTVSAAVVALLPAAGVVDVGENRLQVATPKIEALEVEARGDQYRWHFIGHLQKNKARRAVNLFHLIHSVDSPKLLRALDRLGGERGRPVEALLQVNISGEAQKHGLKPDEVEACLRDARENDGISITGLMGMAPFVADPEEARSCFSRLRRIRDEANRAAWYRIPLLDLSMGMTNDFEIAVEEGATIVRVGTAVFQGVDPALAGDDPPTATEGS